MDSSYNKLVFFAILIVLGFAIVVLMVSPPEVDDTKDEPAKVSADLRFDLYAETIDTSYDSIGQATYPDEGMKYVLLHFRLANDNVSEGIKLNPIFTVWTVVSNGVEYNQDWTTYNHPDLTHAKALHKGGQIDDVRVFQIPKGDNVDSAYFRITVRGLSEHISIKMDESLL